MYVERRRALAITLAYGMEFLQLKTDDILLGYVKIFGVHIYISVACLLYKKLFDLITFSLKRREFLERKVLRERF